MASLIILKEAGRLYVKLTPRQLNAAFSLQSRILATIFRAVLTSNEHGLCHQGEHGPSLQNLVSRWDW